MKSIRVEKRQRSAGRSAGGVREEAGPLLAVPEGPMTTPPSPVRTRARKRAAHVPSAQAVLLERQRSAPPELAVPDEWIFRLPELAAFPAWVAVQAHPLEAPLAPRVVRAELVPPAPPEPVLEEPGPPSVEALWLRYAEQRDIDTRNELVERYRKLVDREARRIAARLPRRVDTRDLETAGVVGLIDAIQGYDLSRGVAFESYGRPRVRGAILDELRRLDWMPRVWRTRRTRRAQAEQALREELGREPGERELADYLGVTAQEFQERYGGPARGLEMAGEGSNGWGDEALSSSDRFEALADPRSGEEESRMQVRELIESLLEELDPEDRRVLLLRYFRGWTMGRIGQLMHISESRVCRIHASILERLKRRLESRRLEILA
ncbi:MAG: sigma-70 family RNA polymerase sigma factor [Planctomycetes bacterium]|nr:sigma-70 family RNA polymerase sigma factor [Planctomycetota bacterium]